MNSFVAMPPTSARTVSVDMAETEQFSEMPRHRYLAVQHTIEIAVAEAGLPRAWQSVIASCQAFRCEVLNSSITTTTQDSTASGNIRLRVAPEEFQKLFENVEKLGKVVQHATFSEDKTTAVIDTEAKVKNLTSFRDSLRSMLAKSSVTVKDAVEIQQQLTDVQSNLDSEVAQRKILANETEKVAVEIGFRVERPVRNAGAFEPIANALRDSGTVLSESVASLITVLASVIPWLVVIVPGLWLIAKVWRKVRRKPLVQTPTVVG